MNLQIPDILLLLRPGQAKAKVIDKRWPGLSPLNFKECRSRRISSVKRPSQSSSALSRQSVATGTHHEVHPCGGDMLDSCNVSEHGAGIARPSTAPVPCASHSFRRAAVSADQQLACESDPGDHPTPRQHLPNDRAGLDAVAGSASPPRTGVSRPVRPR